MIYAAMISLPEGELTSRAWKEFHRACWADDVQPEFVSVAESDCRADGVTTCPTIRVYAEDDPYGDPLVELKGMAAAEKVRALLTEARTML